MNCYLFEAPTYLFFAADLPGLLYYSHIPTSILALLVGCVVFFSNPKGLANRLLLLISVCFTFWILASLTAWTNIHGDLLAFIWPAFGLLAALLAILSIYFTYVFINQADVRPRIKVIFLLLLAPVFLLAYTDASISGFNLTDCDAFGFEGVLYKAYYTLLGFIAMVWIAVILLQSYRRSAELKLKKQIITLGVGIELFLGSFIFITFIVTYLTGLGYFQDSRLEMYGLFGMTFFMIQLSIMIVRYKSFNIRAHAAEALTVALVLLIASQYTYANSTLTTIILTTLTLVLTCLAGAYLIASVRREIAQREQIEHLATNLEKANVRLKALDKLKSEFVSIASHQLRSPLTAIRGYASLLKDGSYGKMPQKAEEALERIDRSAALMAESVEDYLNVSRIESGNMKYNFTDMNLPQMASEVVDDLRPAATRSGLVLLFRSDLTSKGIISADPGKVQQILHNLINNSIKYTKKGSIKVFAHDDTKKKKVYIEIIDTGVGMSADTLQTIFQKFERADNANSVNVHGTGLGLYVAQKMAQEMKGDITAHSEGEGKGSRFIFEMPLQM